MILTLVALFGIPTLGICGMIAVAQDRADQGQFTN